MNALPPMEDPRWTAYLLGELTDRQRAEMDQLLAADPEARKRLEELRRSLDAVKSALASRPVPSPLDPLRKEQVLRAASEHPPRISTRPVTAWAALVAVGLGLSAYLMVPRQEGLSENQQDFMLREAADSSRFEAVENFEAAAELREPQVESSPANLPSAPLPARETSAKFAAPPTNELRAADEPSGRPADLSSPPHADSFMVGGGAGGGGAGEVSGQNRSLSESAPAEMHDLRYAAPAALRLERSRKESTPPLTLSTGTQLDSLSESDKGPDTSAAEPRTRAAAQVLLESLARDGVDPEVRQRLIDALRALTGVEPQADWSPEQTLQAFREAVDRLPE